MTLKELIAEMEELLDGPGKTYYTDWNVAIRRCVQIVKKHAQQPMPDSLYTAEDEQKRGDYWKGQAFEHLDTISALQAKIDQMTILNMHGKPVQQTGTEGVTSMPAEEDVTAMPAEFPYEDDAGGWEAYEDHLDSIRSGGKPTESPATGWFIPLSDMTRLAQGTFANMMRIISKGGQVDVVARCDGKDYRWECDGLKYARLVPSKISFNDYGSGSVQSEAERHCGVASAPQVLNPAREGNACISSPLPPTSGQPVETCTEAFEKWAKEHKPYLGLDYDLMPTCYLFEGFKAAWERSPMERESSPVEADEAIGVMCDAIAGFDGLVYVTAYNAAKDAFNALSKHFELRRKS